MDLSKLRPIDFRRRLDEAESQAIIIRKARNNGLIRTSAGVLTGVGTTIFGTIATIAIVGAICPLGSWVAVFLGLAGLLATGAAAFGLAWRYLEPSERRLLPLLLEPAALDFLEDNWARRDRLLAEAEAFNDALSALRALPERAGGDEIDAGVAANLAERCARFETEAGTYLAEFSAATEEERERVAKANIRRKKPYNTQRQWLSDFKRKVRKLAELERSIDGLLDSVGSGTTVDLAPYFAALRYRAELEEERATLIRCGLTPKKLPKLRINRKFLPSGS